MAIEETEALRYAVEPSETIGTIVGGNVGGAGQTPFSALEGAKEHSEQAADNHESGGGSTVGGLFGRSSIPQ